MKQSAQRPVFLNLLQIRLPLGGILSILHRVSGVLLVLAIPIFVYFLQILSGSEVSFSHAQEIIQTVPGKILISLIVWVLIQHSMSGIRHLMMDLDYGYNKQVARKTATVAFAVSLLLIILTGVLIWL
mgnify:FL=1